MCDVQSCLRGKLFDNCLGKWFYYPHHLPFVVQIECLLTDEVLIYASFDNNGGGAYLSSFLNLLMIEEINSISSPLRNLDGDSLTTIAGKRGILPLNQVSGSVSLTFFSMQKCTSDMSADLALLIYEFTEALQAHLPEHLAQKNEKCWEARIVSLAETKLSQMIADSSEK